VAVGGGATYQAAALGSITTGFNNVGIGAGAGAVISTAAYCTMIGRLSGYNTSGGANTFIGEQAGSTITTGNSHTIIGRFDGNSGGLDIRTASSYIVLSDGQGNPRGIFDNSGNFLVGTTTPASNTDTGVTLGGGSDGYLYVTRNNDIPAFLNRNTSDGNLILFRKDGTAVGSIGVSGNGFYFGDEGDTGFVIDSNADAIIPFNPTSRVIRNNAVNLGSSSGRFKDLYLSGGVYLGGTGSANFLDDYEEGSWTPELTFSQGTTGIVYNSAAGSRSGQYVKIGQFVWLWFYFILSNKGTSTGTAEINGIPFTTTNNFYNENGGVAHAYSGFTGLRSNITTLVGGSNRIYLNHADANSGSITATSNLSNSQFTNGAYLRGHVCYKTAQ